YHTLGVGTQQNVYGAVELTRVEYPALSDIASMSAADLTQVDTSMLMNIMLPLGSKFRPDSAVSRFDLAESLIRAGRAPQYMASRPMFTDVRDPESRNVVESAQSNPSGMLFYDAPSGGRFNPNGVS